MPCADVLLFSHLQTRFRLNSTSPRFPPTWPRATISRPRKRRCLILADGFYEWRKDGGGKTPFFIHLRSGRPFALAGLWEVWQTPDGVALPTCTIITTGPNNLVAALHDRMPVILPPDAYDRWLDPEPQAPADLAPLLVSYPADAMSLYAVSRAVNSPANDSPACIEPV